MKHVVTHRSNAKAVAERMAMPRVEREPCWRCGARADIGCEHSKAEHGQGVAV